MKEYKSNMEFKISKQRELLMRMLWKLRHYNKVSFYLFILKVPLQNQKEPALE